MNTVDERYHPLDGMIRNSYDIPKIYNTISDAINLDLVEEFEMQCKKAMPLIEKESTWVFEMSAANNSPLKYVVNAEYWLFNQLDILAKSRKGREKIIEAYRYIIGKLIEINGIGNLSVNAP